MSAFTPAPTPPSTSDPINFNARADAFLAWMANFPTEAEAYGAFLAAANMFGVVIPYIFNSTTTDADPGAGNLRLGSATQNVSTVIRADNADTLGLDAAALINFMSTGTSTIKGVIRLMKAGDSRVWIYAAVTAVASPTGYKNITISVLSSSSTNPFADGDAVILAFVPKGDKGDVGPNGPWTDVLSAVTISGSPSAVTFTNLPTGYADIRFPYGFTLSGVAIMSIQVSPDGITYSPSIGITNNNPVTHHGELVLTDYLSDNPGIRNSYANVAVGSSPAGVASVDGLSGLAKVTGGIRAIRFVPNAGAFSTGSFLQPRAR